MMTEKRLSTDFAMHNHLKTAKTQHQCFHSHRTPCCNPSDYENNLWIWRTLFCRVTHLTSILFFFFFYIFIPLIWSGSPMKYEPVTHKSTQDGGGWFPNLCSWNANSLTMYRRFTVTAQRHTEKEGENKLENVSVLWLELGEYSLTHKTHSEHFLIMWEPKFS